MNKHYEDDEPAFPSVSPLGAEQGGMTLRDFFAAASLTGLIASSANPTFDEMAAHAWRQADAMLAARAGGGQ